MDLPLPILIVAIALGAAILIVVLRLWQSHRARKLERDRRTELRQRYSAGTIRQQELERLAERIIATSSSPTIAGFEIQRQIEAVFTDGHPSPGRAVQMAKAQAAELGANALINLHSQRLPSGKCQASADAVLVRSLDMQHPAEPSGPSVELEDEPPRAHRRR